jgi:hypothetical protein
MNADDGERERLLAEFRFIADAPCPTGKHKHLSKKRARAQLGSLRANRDNARTGAFLCGYCNCWHVGRR